MASLRVLVACERSQVVTQAFRAVGAEAFSCDLYACQGANPEWHIRGDVLGVLGDGWDLMIAHPPCTYLARSGARWMKYGYRVELQDKAIDFFYALVTARIPRKAIENPVGIMSRIYRKPDQIIQPWQFGHPETKTTCLWLEGLKRLQHTDVVSTHGGQNILGTSTVIRSYTRSITYAGIAQAMAEQWTQRINWQNSPIFKFKTR